MVGAIAELIEQREKNAREAFRNNGRTWRRVLAVKDLFLAVVFLGSLLWGAAVIFQRLADKPTQDQVQQKIETRIAPIEEVQKTQAKAITTITTDVKRTKQVQEVLLEQNAYQANVLEHVANKKRGSPPPKPKDLDDKERALMQ